MDKSLPSQPTLPVVTNQDKLQIKEPIESTKVNEPVIINTQQQSNTVAESIEEILNWSKAMAPYYKFSTSSVPHDIMYGLNVYENNKKIIDKNTTKEEINAIISNTQHETEEYLRSKKKETDNYISKLEKQIDTIKQTVTTFNTDHNVSEDDGKKSLRALLANPSISEEYKNYFLDGIKNYKKPVVQQQQQQPIEVNVTNKEITPKEINTIKNNERPIISFPKRNYALVSDDKLNRYRDIL